MEFCIFFLYVDKKNGQFLNNLHTGGKTKQFEFSQIEPPYGPSYFPSLPFSDPLNITCLDVTDIIIKHYLYRL